MKVKDLIEELKDYPKDEEVVINICVIKEQGEQNYSCYPTTRNIRNHVGDVEINVDVVLD